MKQAIIATTAVVSGYVLLGRLDKEDDDGRTVIEFWSYGSGGADNPPAEFWQSVGPATAVRGLPFSRYKLAYTARK